MVLTHWGRVTHICVSDLTSIGSDNGLSPGRRQAIIRTNAGILLIRPLGTNFSEFSVEILIFSFKKMRLKVSSAKRRPFCLGLNEINMIQIQNYKIVCWVIACNKYSAYMETLSLNTFKTKHTRKTKALKSIEKIRSKLDLSLISMSIWLNCNNSHYTGQKKSYIYIMNFPLRQSWDHGHI